MPAYPAVNHARLVLGLLSMNAYLANSLRFSILAWQYALLLICCLMIYAFRQKAMKL